MKTGRAAAQSPVLVRRAVGVQPGRHSYNSGRRNATRPGSRTLALLTVRNIFFLLGLCAVGFYGYTLANVYVYQVYQNWAFDQQILGHRVNFTDYLRSQTPIGFLIGPASADTPLAIQTRPASAAARIAPTHGALLGRIAIDRLDLSAIVREGADSDTLSRAVGHVSSTSLAGESGNFAIAAHRDTLFRALKDIRIGDLVTFESPSRTYTYQVFSTRIVRPSNVGVLRPDGGLKTVSAGGGKLLTMITCFPFYFVGSAPQRFIVQARLINDNPGSNLKIQSVRNSGPPAAASPPAAVKHLSRYRTIRPVSVNQPRTQRGFFSVEAVPAANSTATPESAKTKKRGFWHRLFHVS